MAAVPEVAEEAAEASLAGWGAIGVATSSTAPQAKRVAPRVALSSGRLRRWLLGTPAGGGTPDSAAGAHDALC